MKLEQFLDNYYCEVNIQNQNNINLEIKSMVISRVDKDVVYSVSTNYDIHDISTKIVDSQSAISLMKFDWVKVVDLTKRAHIDYFAQILQIDDFCNLDRQTNSDISNFYQKVK